MKLHLFDHWHFSDSTPPGRYDNLIYGTLLIAGIPVVVVGISFLVNTLFDLLK